MRYITKINNRWFTPLEISDGIPKRSKSLTGFTLVEMVIVTAMLSVISLAIYATFNSGAKIWQRIDLQEPEEEVNIFFDKFAADLRSCFRFEGMYFLGEEDRVEFPAMVYSNDLEKRTVGRAIYSYNYMEGRVTRRQSDFSQVYYEDEGDVTLSLLNVSGLGFLYYYYEEKTEKYFWLTEWLGDGLPLAVRIELELNDGVKRTKFAKTITIPSSGL